MGFREDIVLPQGGIPATGNAFKLAMQADVTIGCGSDVGVFKHGTNYNRDISAIEHVQFVMKGGVVNIRAATAQAH